MAEKFTSSPGPSDIRDYNKNKNAYDANKTAFQTMSQYVLDPVELGSNAYVKYAEVASDPISGFREFNRIYARLVSEPAPAGSGARNSWEYLQTLLRATKYSKGKTPAGVVDTADRTGLTDAIRNSLAMGETDVISFLESVVKYGGRGGGVKQPDTTTKFSAQVTRAFKLKDLGDATRTYTDAFMLAYNMAPDSTSIDAFKKAWNTEVKKQDVSTATEYKTVMTPVIDKKTGKQKKNAEGVLQYKSTTYSTTPTVGEGFTPEEQSQWMASYIATNFPSRQWNMGEIGGAAKVLYDGLVQTAQANYEKPPTFEEAAPIITKIMGTGNAQVAQQLTGQYLQEYRNAAAKRFMSLAPDLAQGKDASSIVNNYANMVSSALETSVDTSDSLMVKILNYQDSKGNYRLPNEFELNSMLMADPRRKYTSVAKNEAINLAQSLKSQLQLG